MSSVGEDKKRGTRPSDMRSLESDVLECTHCNGEIPDLFSINQMKGQGCQNKGHKQGKKEALKLQRGENKRFQAPEEGKGGQNLAKASLQKPTAN